MKLIVPDYYKNFQCISSACKDNCCIGWEIDIDEETQKFYESQNDDFGKRLKSHMVYDDCCHFQLLDERCAFLNQDNLCDIILQLGDSALCEICREHPRFRSDFEGITEKGIGLCCESAAKLILTQTQKTTFKTLSLKQESNVFFDDTERSLFSYFSRAKAVALALLQNRTYSIQERILFLHSFGKELQFCIDTGNFSDFVMIEQDYLSEIFCNEMRKDFHNQMPFENHNLYQEILKCLQTLEILNKKWLMLLKKAEKNLSAILEKSHAFDCYYSEHHYEYEQLLVYFLHRYFMKGIYDKNGYSPILFACVSTMLIHLIDVFVWMQNQTFSINDQIKIVVMYSKEIEYCPENIELLWDFTF